MVDRIRSKTVMLYDSDIDLIEADALRKQISWSAALRELIEEARSKR